jgi:1-acyl-sn-glycerol-3-phosphate acyltransferase
MSHRLPRAIAQVLESPSWPGTIPRPAKERNIGIAYDTSWARSPFLRATRELLTDAVTVPLTRLATSPLHLGAEHLEGLKPPVIFVSNHASHLDTAVIISALPERFRHHTVVAAAADYFFDRAWKARLSSLALGAIPVERTRVNRKSADLAAELIDEGWNLILYPEGGRSPDGWGQVFRGGAGYLAKRCSVPVVPMHLRGVRPVFPKGGAILRPGKVEVRFGEALWPLDDERTTEDARRFAARIEAAVAVLADEAESDWWSARLRKARGTTPPIRGPEVSSWRRAWALPDSAQRFVRRREKASEQPWK